MKFKNQKTPTIPVFKQKKLLEQAFVHRSYLNEQRQIRESNERLEFLGDAVLELVCSLYLFKNFPSYPEGKMTNIRSKLVQTSTLAWAALNLKLSEKLLLSKGEKNANGNQNPSILADTFEALLGAIYLDGGYPKVEKFIYLALILPFFSNLNEVAPHDYKSLLQEEVQSLKMPAPNYRVIKEVGPDHSKKFVVEVSITDLKKADGAGSSKQKAEQEAAKKALENFFKKG